MRIFAMSNNNNLLLVCIKSFFIRLLFSYSWVLVREDGKPTGSVESKIFL